MPDFAKSVLIAVLLALVSPQPALPQTGAEVAGEAPREVCSGVKYSRRPSPSKMFDIWSRATGGKRYPGTVKMQCDIVEGNKLKCHVLEATSEGFKGLGMAASQHFEVAPELEDGRSSGSCSVVLSITFR
jgi:hypothetical protein